MSNRRSVLRQFVAMGLLTLAGCVDGDGAPQTTEPMPTTSPTEPEPTATATSEPTGTESGVEVSVGPEGRLRFEPETVEVVGGGTVRWTFESPGHNVTTKPGASEKIRLPEGAEPFASYEGDQHFSVNEVGTTFEHTFSVPGEYVYVCAPHADQGMVGTVVVQN